ncbi:phosphotransferase family protein [Nocardia sp. NBC_00511]|uniref:phosphotransferase family protein n=1 Tax=Nocardia sp. NBC_00511 TaxID=2903591 RepID=UPI0030DEE894
MEYRPIARTGNAFQQPPDAGELRAMVARVLGNGTRIVSAVELSDGKYNSTFRIDLGADGPAILRVAPEPGRQLRIEPELMRNEYASLPYLAGIAPLLPRVLGVDFTHAVLGRDFMIESWLPGVPAPAGLPRYPESLWPGYFEQIGGWARTIHQVPGPGFGRVAGPLFAAWSDALLDWFDCAAADSTDVGLDTGDISKVITLLDRHRGVLDEIRVPRLLHGDLWTVNLILAESADRPIVTGIVDNDRTWWGDPESDWPIFMARRRPGTERDAFWRTYGPLGVGRAAEWRQRVYLARHGIALRLEHVRLRTLDAEAATATDRMVRQLLAQPDP